MRFLILTVAAAFFAVLVLAACNSTELSRGAQAQAPSPAPPQVADDVPRITVTDVKTELENKTAVLIDVRGKDAYKTGHVKGARLIPYVEIGERIAELPKDKKIITYCSWPNEHTSAGSVAVLKTKGITNAAAVLGGFEALKKAGFEVVTGEKPEGDN